MKKNISKVFNLKVVKKCTKIYWWVFTKWIKETSFIKTFIWEIFYWNI